MANSNVNTVSSADRKKVKEITDKLEAGLKELFESEKYKNYLSTMSKFHNYSANNIQLITMQCPGASLVAGYQAWRKKFNRHVKKDEHGISILAPAPYIIKELRDKVDPVTGEVVLDKDGMPQTEEVERRIPAFCEVKVFDVSQTEGKPIPELEVKELLSTVNGYEDFKQAVMNIAPFPVDFEDIPGEAKGYFNPEGKRIAVQEGMSESQTLKTMVHETAHAMLHNREVSGDIFAPIKDRNTKEVEAESIAFTVCSHFGIDTSEHSFGYIAGWSSGKDMRELKSSLDTIRRTASKLITEIEEQLRELQRNREIVQDMSMSGQEKESILLIQNSDLSKYSLVNVMGMDAAEVVESLYAMNDEDRVSVAAYLESRGAWVTEIANEKTREFSEYHLDVRYNTDTNEVTDLKVEMAWNERAKEPIGADDVILKITHTDGFEVERITNKTPEQVQEIMAALTKLEHKDKKSIHDCLESYGADYIPISVDGGRNSRMPQFNDFEIDLNKKEVSMRQHLSPIQQAEGIINRLEFAKTAFSDDERNLIVNYAYKLNDMEKTRELAEHIYYEETEGSRGAALIAVIDAKEEIDALPDPMIGLSQMHEYGYTWEKMLPLTKEVAEELFDNDLPVYLLHSDGSETSVESREQFDSYEGICGIEKADWENERNYQIMMKELAESAPAKEAQLLYGDTDKYGIYQLKDSRKLRDFHFAGTRELLKYNLVSDDFREIQPGNYNLIYTGELSDIQGQTQEEKLETIFEKFNIDHPADYKGHSLSVSDIVVLHENGENSTHFVDSFGFTELPHFTRELEGVKEQEADKEDIVKAKAAEELEKATETSGHNVQKPETEQKVYPPLYSKTIEYAIEHGEKEAFRESWELNNECKAAVEEAISRSFDGMHLKEDAVKPVVEEYGAERLRFILANTVKENEWDARFSRDNVTWAMNFFTSGNMPYDAPGNVSLSVGSHPAVLNGFIDMFRREGLEPEKLSEPQLSADMEDEDELIDLGNEREQMLAEMKQSLTGEQERALAFQIADRYISIHETEGGYDYSIMGTDYRLIDGGIYDNPDVSIREALNDIVGDLKENPFDNGARGNIRENDELIPVDYDELIEKVEEADKIEPSNSVVDDFKTKTNELFHEISEMNPSEIEETVKCHVQAVIDGEGLEAEIVDVAVVGSRCRGMEREGSDLDVVVELSTNEREDVLFDTFNEDGLCIGGIKVDINPITMQRTGTLETYLPKVEEYLDGVREAREKEPEKETLCRKQAETEVTLTVAECGEFHDLGDFYGSISTVDEAIAIWKQIPPERMHGIPAIGIHLHTPGTEPIDDVGIDILSGRRFDLDILEYIPDIKGNPKAMEVIAELMAKAIPLIPDLEIDGVMSEEMEAQVWEKRMPDLTPTEQFAVELDRFIYTHDTDLYRGNVPNMTEAVAEITEALKQRDTRDIAWWLADIIDSGKEPEESKRALELLGKLAEYKPLAQTSEMEEQNYNMVDGVLNNGAGEKAQKRLAEKTSLKARLAEKKALVSGQDKDRESQENKKKNQREM